MSDPKFEKQAEGEDVEIEEVDEESVGTLQVDPELEAALAEAAAAIPDSAPGLQPVQKEPTPSVEEPSGELLLDDAVKASSPEAEASRLRREVTDANDKLLRLQADFDNFRRRADRERTEAIQYGAQNLIKDLLSVVDNLERATDHARDSEGGDLQSFLQGIELVQREFLTVLGNHGVSEIEASGKPFDPALHEAMAQVAASGVPPNTIVDVLQKGYQLRDRLVRAARVVVAKPGEGEGGAGEAAG